MNALSQTTATYRAIRDRILAVETDIDEVTLADTLEGLTDLNEVIAAVVRGALLDEAHVGGVKGLVASLEDRMRRLTERAVTRRRVARDAMVEVDLRKIMAPDFTLSVRPGPVGLVVVDEALIPESYWQPREPKLDRSALITDLKLGEDIEGVTLSNPEPVLSVRVR